MLAIVILIRIIIYYIYWFPTWDSAMARRSTKVRKEKPQFLVSGLQATDQNKIPPLHQAQNKKVMRINYHIKSFRSPSGKTGFFLYIQLCKQMQGVTTDTKMLLPVLKIPVFCLRWQRGFLSPDSRYGSRAVTSDVLVGAIETQGFLWKPWRKSESEWQRCDNENRCWRYTGSQGQEVNAPVGPPEDPRHTCPVQTRDLQNFP